MPTQDYPYLVHWKVRGLDKLPDIPLDELVNTCLHRLWEKTISRKRPVVCSTVQKGIRLSWEQIIRPIVGADLATRLAERKRELVLEDARQVSQARRDIRLTEDKRAVMERLAQQLPSPRGGGLHFTRPECQILRSINQEIQACIKEARRVQEIPLKDSPDFENAIKNCTPEALLEDSPWLANLFTIDELTLFAIPSPADGALKILAQRINGLGFRPIRPSTLKKALNPRNFPPIKTE